MAREDVDRHVADVDERTPDGRWIDDPRLRPKDREPRQDLFDDAAADGALASGNLVVVPSLSRVLLYQVAIERRVIASPPRNFLQHDDVRVLRGDELRLRPGVVDAVQAFSALNVPRHHAKRARCRRRRRRWLWWRGWSRPDGRERPHRTHRRPGA